MSDEFSAIAGHRVLDLVNTVDWRLSETRRHERLIDDDAALRWVVSFGFCAAAEARRLRGVAPKGALASGLREIREWTYAASCLGDERAAGRLLRLHIGWLRRATLRHGSSEGVAWLLTDADVLDADTLRLRVAGAAVELLRSPEGGEVSQCADDECGWVYLDTSPRRNRRWCVAADCGARNRARRHYERTRARR